MGDKLAKKLPVSDTDPKSYLGEKLKKTIFVNEIELHEVLEEIQEICDKKAMGYDNIPPRVIKWAPHIFGPILLNVFNRCLQLGIYPDSMKVARVVPIHKGGDLNDVNNYRPISVLTQFNRIFERILANRMLNFFEKHNVITPKQFGFLKRHSTEHAILDLKEYLMANLEKEEIQIMIDNISCVWQSNMCGVESRTKYWIL